MVGAKNCPLLREWHSGRPTVLRLFRDSPTPAKEGVSAASRHPSGVDNPRDSPYTPHVPVWHRQAEAQERSGQDPGLMPRSSGIPPRRPRNGTHAVLVFCGRAGHDIAELPPETSLTGDD